MLPKVHGMGVMGVTAVAVVANKQSIMPMVLETHEPTLSAAKRFFQRMKANMWISLRKNKTCYL